MSQSTWIAMAILASESLQLFRWTSSLALPSCVACSICSLEVSSETQELLSTRNSVNCFQEVPRWLIFSDLPKYMLERIIPLLSVLSLSLLQRERERERDLPSS